MKGSIRTATYLAYIRPYWGKVITRLNYIDKLSPKDKVRYRVNGTVQSEYLDRFYEETSVGKINEILYDCLIEYNFYRPHRSLNLLTPIEYCSKLNNRDAEIVQIYWT